MNVTLSVACRRCHHGWPILVRHPYTGPPATCPDCGGTTVQTGRYAVHDMPGVSDAR